MPRRRRRLLGTGILLAVSAFALSGCGRDFSQTPVPPPPASSVEPLYPCELFTTEQTWRLHERVLPESRPDRDPGSLTGTSCEWATDKPEQDEVYYARLLRPSRVSGVPVQPVAGLPTTDATPNMNANVDCVLDIRLTPSVTLWAEFANVLGDIPNMSHQMACDKARAVASEMVQTFQARTQRSPAK